MENKQEFSPSNHPQRSDDIRQFLESFLIAKRKFKGVVENCKGNFGKYADLEEVYEAVQEPLWDVNINIDHFRVAKEDGNELLHTRLTHGPSGQFIEDTCFLTCDKPGNQAKGSSLTYMKRYAVLNLCGIAPKDDDGQSEQSYIDKKPAYNNNYRPQNTNMKPVVIVKKEEKTEVITQEQLEQLEDSLHKYPGICKTVKEALKIDSLSAMPKGVFLASIKRIEELKKAENK